jgi:hypothetical protein
MKIKNLSQQNLNLSLSKSKGEKTIISLKPNQVLYADNNQEINKQLLIYEKKKLLYVNREMDKPEFVDYYKPFFESGTMNTSTNSHYDVDEEDDDDNLLNNIEDLDFSSSMSDDEDFDPNHTAPKKGRGRPKGIKKEISKTPETTEKKGRGRPKGTIKKEKISETNQDNSAPKKGRGRPKGSTKKENNTVENSDSSESKKLRGRPKGTIKLKVVTEEPDTTKKRGRGRPKGSLNKNASIDKKVKVMGRKRGRPRKNS